MVLLKYSYNDIEYAVSVEMVTHADQVWIMILHINFLKTWDEASTDGSNFDSIIINVKVAALCCTGHLETNSIFPIKITTRMKSCSEKYEGLGGIIGGSITH